MRRDTEGEIAVRDIVRYLHPAAILDLYHSLQMAIEDLGEDSCLSDDLKEHIRGITTLPRARLIAYRDIVRSVLRGDIEAILDRERDPK